MFESLVVLKVVQISDCHLYSDPNQQGYNDINPFRSLQQIFHDIASHSPDLVLVTGDVSGDESYQSYQHFITLWQQSTLCCDFVVLPGNHDDIALMHDVIPAKNLWTHYSLEQPLTIGHWQFPFLNTQTAGIAGHLSRPQLEQLSAHLSSAKRFQLIAAHHHPIACNSWMDKHSWDNAEELIQGISAYSIAKALIYGHIHHASEQRIKHCLLLSCPSTCWQWAMQSEFGVSAEPAGYRILHLGDQGDITTNIIRVD